MMAPEDARLLAGISVGSAGTQFYSINITLGNYLGDFLGNF